VTARLHSTASVPFRPLLFDRRQEMPDFRCPGGNFCERRKQETGNEDRSRRAIPNELDNVTGGSVASVVQSVVDFLLPVQEGAELTEDPNNNYGKDRSRPVSFPD
jgi:hypothetical protein